MTCDGHWCLLVHSAPAKTCSVEDSQFSGTSLKVDETPTAFKPVPENCVFYMPQPVETPLHGQLSCGCATVDHSLVLSVVLSEGGVAAPICLCL